MLELTTGKLHLVPSDASHRALEYIAEEEMASMATHGDAVMYPKLVEKAR